MIQISSNSNTFLIDLFWMSERKDNETIELTKKLLQNVFANKHIIKVLHDCRHDSLALHEFIQTCLVNVFDTSASQTFIIQSELYKKLS